MKIALEYCICFYKSIFFAKQIHNKFCAEKSKNSIYFKLEFQIVYLSKDRKFSFLYTIELNASWYLFEARYYYIIVIQNNTIK